MSVANCFLREETVVAFLNNPEGGEIYIGIDDKTKTVLGVENLDLTQRQIVDKIKNNVQPRTLGLFDILVEKIADTEIIKIIVSCGSERPYYLRKKGMSPEGCFIRVGSSNQHMTKEQIEAMYAKRLPHRLSSIRSPKQTLTFNQLELYYSQHKKKLNDEFLSSLDLLDEDGRYNYAAYLLADVNGVSIKVAKYAGTTKVDLIENEEYGYCCLITATNRVLEKLRVENRTFAKITPQKRLERKMVDEIALKEAFINAVVHNDYTYEVPPVVEIFSDRITITSYGGLPQGLSRENFFRCRSMPRNRELMRVFRDVELVEQLGSGMSRILEAYDRSVFSFEDNFLVITFMYADGFTVSTDIVNDTVNDTVNSSDGTNDTVNDTVNDDLSKNEAETAILDCIRINSKTTLDIIAENTGLSRRTISRKIKLLQTSGVIRRIGSDKTGYWEVVNGGEQNGQR